MDKAKITQALPKVSETAFRALILKGLREGLRATGLLISVHFDRAAARFFTFLMQQAPRHRYLVIKTCSMAILQKGIKITATLGDICLYQRHGRTYTRKRTTLTSERVENEAAFEKTRQYAGIFGLASSIASPIYKALPADLRGRWVFRTIAGNAASLLYKGKTKEEVNDILWKKYIVEAESQIEETVAADTTTPHPGNRKSILSLERVFYKRWKKQGKPKKDFQKAWQNLEDWDKKPKIRLTDMFGVIEYLRPYITR